MGCSCCQNHGEHHHHHHVDDKKKMHKRLIRLVITIALFAVVLICDKIFGWEAVNTGLPNWVLPFILYFAVYLIEGCSILKNAAEGIFSGYFLDENFLMAIASLGAFALGIYRGCLGMEPDGFEEGCAVVLFYCVGEYIQDWALGKSERAVDMLMNAHGVSGISHSRNTRAESFITRFAKVYTPVVAGLAVAVAVIPPVIGACAGIGLEGGLTGAEVNIFTGPLDLTFATWLYRALSFLVVSCPCALVISIPLSFSVGVTAAGRYGVLIRSTDCLELFNGHGKVIKRKMNGEGDMFAVTMDTPESRDKDMALMKDARAGIPVLKKLSRHTMRIIRENIVGVIGIKVAVLILSVFGISNMWLALFADVGVAILAIINALRVGLFHPDR